MAEDFRAPASGSGVFGVSEDYLNQRKRAVEPVQFGLMDNLWSRFNERRATGFGVDKFYAAQSKFDESEMMTPEQIKDEYGYTPEKGLRRDSAALEGGIKQRREKFAREMQGYDLSGATGWTVETALDLGASVVDPLNYALSLGMGSLISKGVTAATGIGFGVGTNIAKYTNMFSAPRNIGQKMLAGGLEEAFESATFEGVLDYASAKTFGRKYTAGDYTTNIAQGFGAGLGFGLLGHAKSRSIRLAEEAKQKISKNGRRIINGITGEQVASNSVIDVTASQRLAVAASQQGESEFSGVGGTLNDGIFTGRFDGATPSVENSQSNGSVLGKGLLLRAGGKSNLIDGTADSSSQLSFDLNNSKLVDGSKPIDVELAAKIRENLKATGISESDIDGILGNQDANFSDVAEYASDVAAVEDNIDVIEAVNNTLRAEGYQGYTLKDGGSESVFLLNTDGVKVAENVDTSAEDPKTPEQQQEMDLSSPTDNPSIVSTGTDKLNTEQQQATIAAMETTNTPESNLNYDIAYERFENNTIITDAGDFKHDSTTPEVLAEKAVELDDLIEATDILAENVQTAYHGTPSKPFEKFETKFINTGEKTQFQGFGLYFASRKDTAKWYKKNVGIMQKKKKGEGSVFQVELPNKELLLNLNGQMFSQPEGMANKIKDVVDALARKNSTMPEIVEMSKLSDSQFSEVTGYQVLDAIEASVEPKVLAKEYLKAGIKGHVYIGDKGDTPNYVIFDEKDVRILTVEEARIEKVRAKSYRQIHTDLKAAKESLMVKADIDTAAKGITYCNKTRNQ